MLSVSGQVQVFLALQPTDMRKSVDTLAALAQGVLQQDPLSGHLFVFRSKRGPPPAHPPLAQEHGQRRVQANKDYQVQPREPGPMEPNFQGYAIRFSSFQFCDSSLKQFVGRPVP